MRRLYILPALLLLLSLVSCRSSTSSGGSGAVADSLAAFTEAFRSVSAALTVAFEQGTKPGEITKYKHALLCDPQGSSNISEIVSDNTEDGTFLVEADLDECGVVSGEFAALGGFTRNTDGIVLNWAYQGTLKGGDCDVLLSDLTVTSSLQGVPALSFVTGALAADCLGDTTPVTVQCSWSQTPVLSQEELLAGCTCSGSGC